jgi:hypothetical protein
MFGEGGPSFYEGERAIDEVARAELCVEIAREVEARANETIAVEIASDPILEAMMATLIEKSLEWDPYRRDHLRKMIALRLNTTNQIVLQAVQEAEFFDRVVYEIERELDELESIPGLEDMADPWDSALQDLLGLYGSDDES